MAVEKRGELSLSKKVIKKATFDDLQISFYKKQTYTGQTAIFSGLELEDEWDWNKRVRNICTIHSYC